MLLQPLISCVVLALNIGDTSAMFNRHKAKPPVNQNNNPLDQPAMAQKPPIAPNLNHLMQSIPESLMQYADFSRGPYARYFQGAHNNQFGLYPLEKISPPTEDPKMTYAKCGFARYDKQDIIYARKEGCNNMPFYINNIISRKATWYFPDDSRKYVGTPPFFLYPIGKPIISTKRTRHYGFDRVVLNQWCQAVGVLTEWPKARELATKTSKYMKGRPLGFYDQRNYRFEDCLLT